MGISFSGACLLYLLAAKGYSAAGISLWGRGLESEPSLATKEKPTTGIMTMVFVSPSEVRVWPGSDVLSREVS